MATLPTLELGTFTNVTGAVIVGAEPVLQLIASAVDSRYVYSGNNNSTGTYSANFALADMPTDFGNMDTLNIRLRYLVSGTALNTCRLTVQVFESDGITFLTNPVDVVANVTNTAAENSAVVALPAVRTAANKATWDGALVRVNWGLTKVKGGETFQRRVTAAEITGTYTATVPETRNGTLAAEFAAFEMSLTGTHVQPTRAGTLAAEFAAFEASLTGTRTQPETYNGTLDAKFAAFEMALVGDADMRGVYLNLTQTLTGAARQTWTLWTNTAITWDVVQGGMPINTLLEHAVVTRDGTVGWSPVKVTLLAGPVIATRGFGT